MKCGIHMKGVGVVVVVVVVVLVVLLLLTVRVSREQISEEMVLGCVLPSLRQRSIVIWKKRGEKNPPHRSNHCPAVPPSGHG